MDCKRLIGASVLLFAASVLGVDALAEQTETDISADLLAAPQEGGARRWLVRSADGVVLMAAPGGQARPGAPFPSTSILTNFGCAPVMGAIWCDVRPMHGGPRGYVEARHLETVAGPDGVIATGLNDSPARAKRRRFDATAQIPCAQEQGQALGICDIGVSRSQGGDVTVAATFHNGFTRLLYFMHGEFISANATMSGAGRDTDWHVADGVHSIRADDQRFEIPHALLFGTD